MKKILYLSAFTFICLILLFSFNLSSKSGGAPVDGSGAGFSGGRMENGRTCATSGCHSGTASEQSGLISTNIDSSGYIPGQTYQITITATKTGMTRTGFQLSAQDLSGQFAGTLLTGSNEMQANSGYITHTKMGTSCNNGSRTWTVDWTAPAAGTGSVEFSTAVNLSNHDGTAGGDNIVKEVLTVDEASTTGLAGHSLSNIDIRYLASSGIRVDASEAGIDRSGYSIFNTSGQEIMSGEIGLASPAFISSEGLPAGIYIFNLNDLRGATIRFVKQ